VVAREVSCRLDVCSRADKPYGKDWRIAVKRSILAGGCKAVFVRSAVLGALVLMGLTAWSQMGQMGGASSGELQQKLMALKQSAAENKQKLHQYQWIETRQIVLKGESKPEQVFQCSYLANGQIQRIPMGSQPQQQQRQGGKLRQRIVEKKTEEMKDYMQSVQSLLSLYVPPNANLIQQAIQNKNVSIERDMGASGVDLVFKNYAKPGDQMTITFNPQAHKVSNINVNTYMDEPKDVVTLAVQMASLADGTNYAQQSVLNATAKQLQVTTTNSNYVKLQ
jgi:hypothetical protein